MKISITGYGIISAIGLNINETIDSLRLENSGIKQGAFSEIPEKKVGMVLKSNEELAQLLGINETLPRTTLLGMIAAREAFQGHSIDSEIRTGVISGTSVGGMDLSETVYSKRIHEESFDEQLFGQHPSGIGTEKIAEDLGIKGFTNTISTACSSGANALLMGARMIEHGILDRVVVGGTDGLCAFTINGFSSLMIYDQEFCKPFDARRKGLNLGEGAGFVVLESEASVKKTGKQPLATLSGWACTSDAHHQTASSPDGKGATLAMAGALGMAKLTPEQIDYVNAHGTATPNNDQSESQALRNIFGDQVPAFSSTKAYTGHTLAASGSIEAIFSTIALENGYLYPNLRFEEIIEETQLTPQLSFEEGKDIRHIMSNSFGFGGNSTTLILSAV